MARQGAGGTKLDDISAAALVTAVCGVLRVCVCVWVCVRSGCVSTY